MVRQLSAGVREENTRLRQEVERLRKDVERAWTLARGYFKARVATLEAALREARAWAAEIEDRGYRDPDNHKVNRVLAAIDTALGAQQGKGEP